jgi:Zn-dependent peptidase ImmA (M78 family)
MNINWKTLARQAMYKSVEIRAKERLGTVNPICVYDLCKRLGVSVRFVPVSMEGLYIRETPPTILLSSLRPLARRNFTCGHEIGHHVFGHSSLLDEILEETGKSNTPKPDEFLVNTFAGFLLMPVIGIKKAFTLRNLEIGLTTPEQFFTIACSFGVGYETLLGHLAYSLKILAPTKAESLAKVKPKQIRNRILGFSSDNPLIIADRYWSLPTLDAEVGTLLLLPHKTEAENNAVVPQTEYSMGRIFIANRPGIVKINSVDSGWTITVQISKKEFAGPIKFRFAEEVTNEK